MLNFEKIVKLIIGFSLTIIFLYIFKLWAFENQRYFSMAGRTEDLILVVIIGLTITYIIEKLWKWEVKELTKPKRKPKWIRH